MMIGVGAGLGSAPTTFYASSGTVATRVVAMTRGLKTRREIRAVRRRPAHAHARTMGASSSMRGRCSVRSRPMLIVKGALMMFTVKKNHAVVPRNSLTEKREARKYMEVNGPPAFAAIVVNPASVS